MTVRKLREWLADKPEEMRVLVAGYEGDYDDLQFSFCSIRKMALDVNPQPSYLGAHEIYEEGEWSSHKDKQPVDCVILDRSELP